MGKVVKIGNVKIGGKQPLALIAGPCVIESREACLGIARRLAALAREESIPLIFKASFDKANRTSITSYRGPGIDAGLASLARIRQEVGVPVVSDIHEPSQAKAAAEVLDIIQVPAFLCRQTDLLAAISQTGKPINLKKGQFVSPWDMVNAVSKIRESGTSQVMLVERGASFGYNNLVVDMRSFPVLRGFDCPVIYDATHSVQLPGGAGGSSGGQREFIAPLSRAAVGAGIDGLFMEVHPDPDNALCDGPNSLPLNEIESLLKQLVAIRTAVA